MEPARTGELEATGTLADFMGHALLRREPVRLEAARTPFRILLGLAERGAEGLVGFYGPEGRAIVLVLSEGDIVETVREGESRDEALIYTILEGNLLPRERLVRAAQYADETGVSLVRALFERHLMEPRRMLHALRDTVERHVTEALEIETGRYVFVPRELLGWRRPPEQPGRMPVLTLLHRFLRDRLKRVYLEELEGVIAPVRRFYLRVPEEFLEHAGVFGFDKREVHTMRALLDGAHRIDDVTRLGVLSRTATARFFFSLAVLGLCEFLDESTRKVEVETLADQLRALAEELEHDDPFHRVGAHWSTPEPQLRTAYRHREAEYGPGGSIRAKAEAEGPEALAACERIWELVQAGWAEVRTAEGRRQARKRLVDETQLRFSAGLLIAQGRTAELERRFAEARILYQTAAELADPPEARKALQRLARRQYEWERRVEEDQS